MQDLHCNSEGKEKEELACILVQHGQDIQLTIDANLQVSLYEQFKEDKSCSVAMNLILERYWR